jgi:hypothetical protein
VIPRLVDHLYRSPRPRDLAQNCQTPTWFTRVRRTEVKCSHVGNFFQIVIDQAMRIADEREHNREQSEVQPVSSTYERMKQLLTPDRNGWASLFAI